LAATQNNLSAKEGKGMTLIVMAGNRDNLFLVADRRLTTGSTVVSESQNKLTQIECPNGSFVIGFAGIAEFGTFKTQEWMLKTLYDLIRADGDVFTLPERLSAEATKEFINNRFLRALKPDQKALSFMMGGFLTDGPPLRMAWAMLSNFQDFQTGDDGPVKREFSYKLGSNDINATPDAVVIQRIGVWRLVDSRVLGEIQDALTSHMPQERIAEMVVGLMRSQAQSPIAKNTVGRVFSCVRIPSSDFIPVSSYLDNEAHDTKFHPDQVTYKLNGFAIKGFSVGPVDPEEDKPMFMPRVGRNERCSCGSGNKYKACHGK
jgi:hypothetical protein